MSTANHIRKAVVTSSLSSFKALPITRSIPLRSTTIASTGPRFYSQQCTNSVRKTLHSSHSSNSSHHTRLSTIHPSSSLNSSPIRFSHVIRRGFADKASTSLTTETTAVAPKKAGVFDKIKILVKQYGYTGLAVYLGISTLDLAATFVIVKAAGMDKIEQAQDWVLDNVGGYFGYKTSAEKHAEEAQKRKDALDSKNAELDSVDDAQVGAIYNKASGLWSVFVIAYGIHKLLVPLRVVATSMITPPLVKWLVKRGWIKEVAKAAPKTGAAAASTVKP
ncbi:hypothetical protein BG006_008208 [Podila minutissima]|uniref:DUF1279 domain-containing protein n=1 Tax=Podila minutissima TaxID=64525 RepID=A0A9P5SKD5_9FUNG|nr:hypothetical protein BG006_008208 [Podila minutissima]